MEAETYPNQERVSRRCWGDQCGVAASCWSRPRISTCVDRKRKYLRGFQAGIAGERNGREDWGGPGLINSDPLFTAKNPGTCQK